MDATRERTGATGDAASRWLWFAAVYNFAAVPVVVLAVRYAPEVLGVDPTTASQRLYVDLVAWLVACFGAGYALAARDLARYWPCVALGVAGKAGVAALALSYWAGGHAGPLVAALAAGDAAFAVMFVAILRRRPGPTESGA